MESSEVAHTGPGRTPNFAGPWQVFVSPRRQGAIDFAHSIKIEALRKVGEMLKDTPKNSGTIRRGTKSEPRDETPTLTDLGLDKKTSSIAQKLA